MVSFLENLAFCLEEKKRVSITAVLYDNIIIK